MPSESNFSGVFFFHHHICFLDTLKAFEEFKNKQKSVWSNVFWYAEVCIINTLYIEVKHMLKKFPLIQKNGTNITKNKRYKKCPLFFRELQLITVLLFICDSYMSWSTRFVALKLGFSIFDLVLCLLKFILLFNKMHGLWWQKSHAQFCSQISDF